MLETNQQGLKTAYFPYINCCYNYKTIQTSLNQKLDKHNLKFIEVAPETPFDTEWVQSFIKIGSAWELFTQNHGGNVTGKLSAYGIQLESNISLKSYEASFEALKRLTDVNAGNLMNDKYTYVTTIKIVKPCMKSQRPFKLRSRNWVRVLFRLFNGYKKTAVTKGFIHYANSKEQLDKLIDLNVNQYSNFGWIKRSNSDIIIRFYTVEDSVDGINKYVKFLNKLINYD